jgi:hypothetical protein
MHGTGGKAGDHEISCSPFFIHSNVVLAKVELDRDRKELQIETNEHKRKQITAESKHSMRGHNATPSKN